MIFASLPALVQSFFTDRLLRQRHASPHTIAGYRDSFRMLLHFAAQRLDKAPSDLLIEDLDAPFIGEFLQHLEADRGNSARTRNTRLAAIHSFFRYVALTEPAHALVCQHPGDAQEALREEARRVPRPRGDRGLARRSRSIDLDRASRPDTPLGRDPDRTQSL